MGATLIEFRKPNGTVKALNEGRGMEPEQGGNIRLFPALLHPPPQLEAQLGAWLARWGGGRWAEPKLWAQVFSPKFLDPLIGALGWCIPNPTHRRAARGLLGWEALRLPGPPGSPGRASRLLGSVMVAS